jgi:hypothetical protein
VICLDRSLERLRQSRAARKAGLIIPIQADLVLDPWPFDRSTLGAILDVHYLRSSLFRDFARSLRPRGHLLLETFEGHGGNYLELPKSGELRSVLCRAFDFEFYRETKVGPRGADSVSVQLLAVRR